MGIVFLVDFNPADEFHRLGVGVRFVDEVDTQKHQKLVRFEYSIQFFSVN